MCDKIKLWEILVPTTKRVQTPKPQTQDPKVLKKWSIENSFSTRYHRVWDERVRAITGGLTIMTPSKGQWISSDGTLFIERMIPVRIAATRSQIDTIIDMTMSYYDQLAVMCYCISETVIIKERK
jgi:hypothetical protein